VEQWNKVLMPQVDRALRSFYRKNAKETVEISLESIGESPALTQPTVLVICTSVNKVRHILKRKLGALFDGSSEFALKVCSGRVVRSRNLGVQRSMAGEGEEIGAANGEFQERPLPGASIGAWIGDRHLPPVSFGGLIVVDDKPYGMTVHHMLDDPEQMHKDVEKTPKENERSMAHESVMDLAAWYAESQVDADSSGSEDFACEFDSDSDDAASESAITSDYESEASDDEQEHEEYTEAGDIPGIEPGCGEGYIVTQPALDDVPDGFYPSVETANEDHLSTYTLGDVFASSGIRRKADSSGLVHEIDWALFEFNEDRMPDDNEMPKARSASAASKRSAKPMPRQAGDILKPMSVAPASKLPGLEVQCIARTSGLQTGLILPALTSVKIYGRTSPSHTYQVSGAPAIRSQLHAKHGRGIGDTSMTERRLPMGIPGDSGAWIVDCDRAQLCGHVLAWSQRKRVAYICPMEMLLQDIADTLGATDISLPGGASVVSKGHARKASLHAPKLLALNEESEEDSDANDNDWEDERLMGSKPAPPGRGGRRFARPLPRYSEHDESPEPSPPIMAVSRESTFVGEADDNVSVATETEPPTYDAGGEEESSPKKVEGVDRDLKRLRIGDGEQGDLEVVGRQVGVP
jgi:hypothetical protein